MQELEIFQSGDGLIGIRFITGSIRDARLERYEPQARDVVVEDGRLFRDDVEIGTIVGPDGGYILPVDTFDPGPYAALFERTNGPDAASDAAIDQLADWSVELNGESVAIADLYRKSKIAESARVDGFQTEFVREHVIHIDLGRELSAGETVSITGPGGVLDAETATLAPRSTRSDAVHVNQVGFAPDDPSKIAVLSTWLGVKAGEAESAQRFANGVEYDPGTPFHVVDVATGERVLTGAIELLVPAENDNAIANGGRAPVNLAAADTWLMDFSALGDPGRYVVEVEGIGTSYEFEIAPDVWSDLLVTGARGFYHQRSGIALERPYTDWERPASLSPEDGQVAVQSTASILDTANSFNGRWITPADYAAVGVDAGDAELYTFTVLENGSTGEVVEGAWGGWHDAGDWDRRTQHIDASNRMMELLEINRSFFEGIDLNIPESGNAVPDILDEALWNVDFFQRLQRDDGGVSGGIEGGTGPDGEGFQYGEASWANSRELFVYAPDPWTSAEFAAAAARASRLVESYDANRAATYAAEAEAALEWAIANWIGPGDRRLGAPENAQNVVDARNLAALELFKTTGDERWEAEFLATSTHANGGPISYYDHQLDAVFAYLTMDEAMQDAELAAAMRADFLRLAETTLNNYGTPSGFGTADNPFAPYLFSATGTNPQEAAELLARAHALTGDARFLEGTIEDANYALGLNPDNVSFVSGVGDEQVRELLIADAEALGGELPPGIVAYGNYDYFGNVRASTGLTIDQVWPRPGTEAIYPQDPTSWPGYESWQGYFSAVPLSEFTVHEPMGTSTYVWGYLAQLNAGTAPDPEPPVVDPEPPAPDPEPPVVDPGPSDPEPPTPDPEPPASGLRAYSDYEIQIGTVLTLVDAESGFTAFQAGPGERFVFADGVAGSFDERGGVSVFSATDSGDAYPWARAVIRSDGTDQRNWDRIDTTLDEDGRPLSRTVLRDDGTVAVTRFEAGVPSDMVRTDERDAYRWDRVEVAFENGERTSSNALMDDGTTTWTNFAEGARANVTRADPGDVRPWETIYTEYEDGIVKARFRTDDDGDVAATFFDDGVRERTVFTDVSDSRPWETRTTIYDPEGNVLDILLV